MLTYLEKHKAQYLLQSLSPMPWTLKWPEIFSLFLYSSAPESYPEKWLLTFYNLVLEFFERMSIGVTFHIMTSCSPLEGIFLSILLLWWRWSYCSVPDTPFVSLTGSGEWASLNLAELEDVWRQCVGQCSWGIVFNITICQGCEILKY